jgi:nitric oxide reductase subunit B
MQKPIIHLLVWMRVPGDTIFSVGALSLAWFVLRLWVAPRARRRKWTVRRCRGREHAGCDLP